MRISREGISNDPYKRYRRVLSYHEFPLPVFFLSCLNGKSVFSISDNILSRLMIKTDIGPELTVINHTLRKKNNCPIPCLLITPAACVEMCGTR